MSRHIILFILLTCLSMTYGQNHGHTNRIILKVKDDTNRAQVDSISTFYNALSRSKQSLGKKSSQSLDLIHFPTGTDLQQVIQAYERTDQVEYVEPDYTGTSGGLQSVPPNDPSFSRQWGLKNTGTFSMSPAIAGADLDMENAWRITQGDSNIIVAVIDGGAKLDHPEFSGRIWINQAEVPGNGVDDDQNGFVDDVRGWDFANRDNNPTDDNGHGTNVAGIIGANANNGIGYAGVDWNCKLMILKAIDDSGNGTYSWWSAAIIYAVDHGARVINMSLGGSSTSTTLRNAVNYALNNRVVVVVSMMNYNTDEVNYPAGYAGVIAVGATNPNDTRANPFHWSPTSGSSFGSHISVVAPGNYIYGLDHESNTNYFNYWSGTSQAAPYVSGLSSLLLAQDSSRTPAQIKSLIEGTAEDGVGDPSEDTPGWDPYYGHGRINAYLALSVYNPTGVKSQVHKRTLTWSILPGRSILLNLPVDSKQVMVFDLRGVLLHQYLVPKNTFSMPIQLSQPGVYGIRVQTQDQAMHQRVSIW